MDLVEWSNYISLVIAVLFWIYAVYCMMKGGTHAKGKGWVSKYTNPITYRINQTIYLFLGFFSIVSFFVFDR